MLILPDEKIRDLIAEKKKLPAHLHPLGTLTERSRHERRDFKVSGTGGSQFCVFIRKSMVNPVLDFSVVLGYPLPESNRIFRLRRYNGKAHFHTNVLEKQTFYDFHVHTATERYQRADGFREEHFAEVTDRYQDLRGAIQCLIDDCGFRDQFEETPLFKGLVE